jgi:hypothetical protein
MLEKTQIECFDIAVDSAAGLLSQRHAFPAKASGSKDAIQQAQPSCVF